MSKKMSQKSKKEIRKCKYGVVKHCAECKERFLATKWCGELTCQPCLDMAWLIDDDYITNLLFTCCPAHRPLVMDILIENHPCETDSCESDSCETDTTTKIGKDTNAFKNATKDIVVVNPVNDPSALDYDSSLPSATLSTAIPRSKPIPISTNDSTTKSKSQQRSFVQSFHKLLSNTSFF